MNSLTPYPRSLIPVFLIAAMLLFPAAAAGQTKATLTPRISISETYDDNVDLERNSENSDWITVVSPGATFQLRTQYTMLDLDLEAGLSFYLQDSSNDTIRYTGQIAWDQELAKYLGLHVSNTLTRSEDPVTEEDGRIVDIATERDVQYRNTGEISLVGQFGSDDRVTVGYRNHLLDSRADQTQDSRANVGFLSLDSWFIPQFGIQLTSDFTRWEFQQSKDFDGIATEDLRLYQAELKMNYRWRPQRTMYARYNIIYSDADDEIGTDTDDYYVHESALGLSIDFGPHTSLEAEVGYFLQDPDEGDTNEGFVLNANFSARKDKTSLVIQTNSGANLDYGTSDNLGFSKFSDNSAYISHKLAEDFSLIATAQYRWEDFTETNSTDHTYSARAGLKYTFLRWLSVSLEGWHLRRDSDINREFKNNRVILQLTTAYPIPLFAE